MKSALPNAQDNLVDIILNTVDDPMLVTDAKGEIVRVNRAFEDVFGYRCEEVRGENPSLLKSDFHEESFFTNLWQTLLENGSYEGEIVNRTKNGDDILTHCKINTQLDENGQILYMVSRMKIDGPHSGHSRKSRDDLTGLPDHDLFSDRLQQAMIAVSRIGKSVALLYIGLDRFSRVNDGLGYAVGDQLLKQVSKRLIQCMRGTDTVARLGGDNFAMALQVRTIDDGVIVAEKVLKSMQVPFEINQQEVNLTTSIGISFYPKDSKNAGQLMKQADSALHHAKKRGGNAYQFFAEDMNVRAKKRIEMENAIRHGIENEEFVLYYQPKVAAGTEKIVGAEALIRWISPSKGFMPPGEFIPVAEETGLIAPLGSWVLNEAVRQNKAWQDEGLPPIRLAVNVAAPQFRTPAFITELKDVLSAHALAPDWLELEIVESMLMGDTDLMVQKLHAVRDIGCHLSIDDFGTGYSSLSYLTRFPITTLKIDRAFIHDLENDPTMAEISRAIIGMSQGLQLEVVAEGAENQAHIEFLRNNGCQLVQGFYYSKPVPADEFAALLKVGELHG